MFLVKGGGGQVSPEMNQRWQQAKFCLTQLLVTKVLCVRPVVPGCDLWPVSSRQSRKNHLPSRVYCQLLWLYGNR